MNVRLAITEQDKREFAPITEQFVQAIGYLVLWGINSYSDLTIHKYSSYSDYELTAYYSNDSELKDLKDGTGQKRNYVIGAVFDKNTQKYTYHS